MEGLTSLGPSIPVLQHARSDISNDDNLDTEIPKEYKRRSKKPSEDRYLGLASTRTTPKKKKKEKKEKPAGPPPFEHVSASRYLLSGGLCGISLCFELKNLLEGHEKLFGVIFVANIALGNSISGELFHYHD